MRKRATELEYLKWFCINANGDVKFSMDEQFMKETGKNLPEGWNFGLDGETCIDKEE